METKKRSGGSNFILQQQDPPTVGYCNTVTRTRRRCKMGYRFLVGLSGGVRVLRRKNRSAQSHRQARSGSSPAQEGGFRPRGWGGPHAHHVRQRNPKHLRRQGHSGKCPSCDSGLDRPRTLLLACNSLCCCLRDTNKILLRLR